jgi:hypothetical protein
MLRSSALSYNSRCYTFRADQNRICTVYIRYFYTVFLEGEPSDVRCICTVLANPVVHYVYVFPSWAISADETPLIYLITSAKYQIMERKHLRG